MSTDRYVRLLHYGSPEDVAAAIRADVPPDYRWSGRKDAEIARRDTDRAIRLLEARNVELGAAAAARAYIAARTP